ncbi:hypothetical protein BHE74_00012002 [Ensete ventricosum]|nr:hypothetical protein BHE74_00012002 [Ensete ventricosum]
MSLRLLASAIAAPSSSTLKSFTKTNPPLPSPPSPPPFAAAGVATGGCRPPRRPLTERRKWARDMAWMASLILSCRSQILSRTASTSSISISISHLIEEEKREEGLGLRLGSPFPAPPPPLSRGASVGSRLRGNGLSCQLSGNHNACNRGRRDLGRPFLGKWLIPSLRGPRCDGSHLTRPKSPLVSEQGTYLYRAQLEEIGGSRRRVRSIAEESSCSPFRLG